MHTISLEPTQVNINRNFKFGIVILTKRRQNLIARNLYQCNVIQCLELRTMIHYFSQPDLKGAFQHLFTD